MDYEPYNAPHVTRVLYVLSDVSFVLYIIVSASVERVLVKVEVAAAILHERYGVFDFKTDISYSTVFANRWIGSF
jgi:hypothetical protein